MLLATVLVRADHAALKHGEETLQRVMAAGKKRLARLFEGWTKSEIEELTVSMSKLADALKTEMENNRE